MTSSFGTYQPKKNINTWISSIYCEVDWIYLNKRECLYMDQIKSSDDIISFEYYEEHSRLIHANYEL